MTIRQPRIPMVPDGTVAWECTHLESKGLTILSSPDVTDLQLQTALEAATLGANGTHIGSGAFADVYRSAADPDLATKYFRDSRFTNYFGADALRACVMVQTGLDLTVPQLDEQTTLEAPPIYVAAIPDAGNTDAGAVWVMRYVDGIQADKLVFDDLGVAKWAEYLDPAIEMVGGKPGDIDYDFRPDNTLLTPNTVHTIDQYAPQAFDW